MKYTLLDAAGMRASLAQRILGAVNSIRDLRVRLGFRPYIVRIIRTRWSLGERGKGTELITWEQPILPTPAISDMSGVVTVVNPGGVDEVGSIMLTEVNGCLTEDNLLGKSSDGSPAEPDTNFWWEVLWPLSGERRRFFIHSAPFYNPEKFGWIVRLERSHEDRQRSGDPR